MNHDNNKVTLEGHAKLLKMFAERYAPERGSDYSLSTLMKKDTEGDAFIDESGVSRKLCDINDYFVEIMPEKFEGFKPGVFVLDSLSINSTIVKSRERDNL